MPPYWLKYALSIDYDYYSQVRSRRLSLVEDYEFPSQKLANDLSQSVAHVKAQFAEHALEAVKTLSDIMHNGSRDSMRLKAAIYILEVAGIRKHMIDPNKKY